MNVTARDFEESVRRDTAEFILRVLERGANLRAPASDLGRTAPPIAPDLVERFRALRTRILNADLYELLYGELPPHAIEPCVNADPFPAVARGDQTNA